MSELAKIPNAADGAWHTITMEWKPGENMRTWIDGVEVTRPTVPYIPTSAMRWMQVTP